MADMDSIDDSSETDTQDMDLVLSSAPQTNTPATELALSIPLILEAILDHVEVANLFEAAHVCRRFREPALRRLWAGCYHSGYSCSYDFHARTPNLCVLNGLASTSPATLATYLSYVKFLHIRPRRFGRSCIGEHEAFWNQPAIWSKFTGRRIRIQDTTVDEALLFPMFKPGLRILSLLGDSPRATVAFFDTLQRQCPGLKHLAMRLTGFDLTAAELIAFLDAMPKLEQLEFHEYETKLLTTENIVRILARPNLRRLLLDFPHNIELNDTVIGMAQRYQDEVYNHDKLETPRLILDRVVKLGIRGSVSTLVLNGFTALRAVTLNSLVLHEGSLADIAVTILKPLSQCSELEDVNIQFEPGLNSFVDADGLVEFARRTPQMSDFTLSGLFVMAQADNRLPAKTLVDMFEKWRWIRTVCMDVPFQRMASGEFWSIAGHSRHLNSLEVWTWINIEHHEGDPDERFHCLTWLSVNDIWLDDLFQEQPDEVSGDAEGAMAAAMAESSAGSDSSAEDPEVEAWYKHVVEKSMAIVEKRMPLLSVLFVNDDSFFGNEVMAAMHRPGQHERRDEHSKEGSMKMKLQAEWVYDYQEYECTLHFEALDLH